MTLVRVYCGLAAAEWTSPSAAGGQPLTAAVVDDSGRLLDLYEITDDADGYAALTALLAERSTGDGEVPVAVERGERIITALASTAGRPLALAGEDAVLDYAERFGDDESADEVRAPEAERRAVGLARALQAGALWATTVPAPPELAPCRPLLIAYGALTQARHGAAVALREVLRELHPAALSAFADPTSTLSLAILEALPEPSALTTGDGGHHAVEQTTGPLISAGHTDRAAVEAGYTALRIAVADYAPHGRGIGADVAAFVVRQAITALRVHEASQNALVDAVHTQIDKLRRSAAAAPSMPQRTDADPSGGRAGRLTTPPTRRPAAPTPRPGSTGQPGFAASTGQPGFAASAVPPQRHPDEAAVGQPIGRRTPPEQRPGQSPADSGQPFRADATRAEIDRTRAERRARAAGLPPNSTADSAAEPLPTRSAHSDLPMRSTEPARADQPPARTAEAPAARASADTSLTTRTSWPLVSSSDPHADLARPYQPVLPANDGSGRSAGRVTPPWQADDLPPEPPTLRLVEPAPLGDRALRPDSVRGLSYPSTPPLRLVEEDLPRRDNPIDRLSAAVSAEGDGDLLIFAATRSAWFTGQDAAASDVNWTFSADAGWRAAEEAAEPSVGVATNAGLPRRVPKANLVPGSPEEFTEPRPLRIVRDAASIAAHTTGYFSGWRRGQEIGGYAVGGRPGREVADGWDFSRTPHPEDDADLGYRQARS